MLFGRATAFSMSYFEQATHYYATPHLGFTKFCPAPHTTDASGLKGCSNRSINSIMARRSAHRKQFNDFFSSLHMKTLQFLVKTVGALRFLKSSQHDSKYQQAVSELKEQIKQLAKPKRIGKLRMTGTALAELVETWTENMQLPTGDYRIL